MTASVIEDVAVIIPDEAGGIANLIRNILVHRKPGRLRYRVILIDRSDYYGSRIVEKLQSEWLNRIQCHRDDNLYATCRQVQRLVKDPRTLIVTNNGSGLSIVAACRLTNPVLHIVHGNYDKTYQEAIVNETVVDQFVAVSRHIHDSLVERIHHRTDEVRYLAHPIPPAPVVRKPEPGPIRLIYIGRLVPWKGVFQLPKVDQALLDKNIEASWTLAGDGPSASDLRAQWESTARVHWLGEIPNDELRKSLADHDVLVFPSESEGFPLTIPEAMSAGVVPITSDLPSGIPEVVENGVTGYRCPVNDANAMADRIAQLHVDRSRLETMSRAAADRFTRKFEATARAADYEELFIDLIGRSRSERLFPTVRSRFLDRRYLPNPAVRLARGSLRTFSNIYRKARAK